MSTTHELSNPVNSSPAAAVTIISDNGRSRATMTKYSVSHVFSFSHCPSELPSIVALPVPSSHPPTVFVWRSLFPCWARVQGCQAEKPQGRALFEPLLSPWFDAVHLSVVGCLCQALQEVHYFRALQRQSLSLPPSLKSPLPPSAAILSSWVKQQGHSVLPSIFCLWSETTVMHFYIQPDQSRHEEREK